MTADPATAPRAGRAPILRRGGSGPLRWVSRSSLGAGGDLLLGVLVQLVGLGLEGVDEAGDLAGDEGVPVLLVRVVVRADPVDAVHLGGDLIDRLEDLLPGLGDAGRDLATLLRIHSLESH